jgi:membrane protein DedA with SNARE-associated domain
VDLIGDLLAALDSLTQTLAGMLTDSPLTYLLVFGLVALDVLFPLLPAEASVLIAAVLAGTGRLSLAWVVVAATLGAFVGDNVAYWIGRAAGRPLVERVMRGHAERLEQVGDQFHDRGGSFIIIGRFVPGGRTAVSVGAGVLHYPWARFIAYDAVAAVVWALQAALPGYIGGVMFADRPWIGLAIGVVLAVVITVTLEWIRRIRGPRRASGAVATRAGAGAGVGAGADLPVSPSVPVPGETLHGGDPEPGTDRRPQEAVVAETEDRSRTHEGIGDPGSDDRGTEGREGVPSDAPEDDEIGARLERAHENG